MRRQFDSCYYGELTSCIRSRIEWIRESRRFLDDPFSEKYGYIRASVIIQIATMQLEIRRLLKMRRVLKKSGLMNWDSDRLEVI